MHAPIAAKAIADGSGTAANAAAMSVTNSVEAPSGIASLGSAVL